jgi:hypothetical protein
VVVTAAEAAEIDTILDFYEFDVDANHISIAQDGLESFANMLSLTEKDVGALAKGFQERTAADGRIVFGLRRTNLLNVAIHWAQDFRRISRNVALGAVLQPEFHTLLKTARQTAVIRKHNAEESDGRSKAADPGKLKRQKNGLHGLEVLQISC